MKNVTYINAGAGSGKTYTLTEKLTQLIKEGKTKPEQVILTTFTTKAAYEFKEKAKAFLYEERLYDEAARLDHAMIGTVHGICQRLIGKYWFHLGLTPAMGVMAEEDRNFYVSQSLADLPTDEELTFLHRFCEEFDVKDRSDFHNTNLDYDFWQKHLNHIIALTTNYEIADYKRSIEESVAFIRNFVHKDCNVSFTQEECYAVYNEHLAFLQVQKETATNSKRLETMQQLHRSIAQPGTAWYYKMSEVISAIKKRGPRASEFVEKAADIWHSKQVFEWQERYIRLMFDLAQRWNENFAAFKREKNLLDYNDMEKYMRLLLADKGVAAEIGSAYRFLFVDEFQDCSPIQVKIFDTLSDLMEHSYWVGDYKQAIYGFRGSDIALTQCVVERAQTGNNGCDTQTLKTSYRSVPEIVEVNNAVFTQTFANVLDDKNIHLEPHRESIPHQNPLRYFRSEGDEDIVGIVAKLLDEGAKPNEIAVLARCNNTLQSVAEGFETYNIPISRANCPVAESQAWQLVEAYLRFADNNSDNLAKATIMRLAADGFSTEELLEKKIDFDDNEFHSREDFLMDDLDDKELLPYDTYPYPLISISALVERIIIQYDILRTASNLWGDAASVRACLQTIINTARSYEAHCIQMNLPTSVDGFITYINLLNPAGNDNPEGVQLHTYHSSKGLQWKYVILLELNIDCANERKIISNEIYDVHPIHTAVPTADIPYPETYIRLTPWIMGAKKKLPSDIEEQLMQMPEVKTVYKAAIAEANRLLYVGMTRARDVLLLNIGRGTTNKHPLQWFEGLGVSVTEVVVPNGDCNLLNTECTFSDYSCTLKDDSIIAAYFKEDDDKCVRLKKLAPTNSKWEERYKSPSDIHGTAHCELRHDFGMRIPFAKSSSDMALVGDCIHQIFACMNDDLPDMKALVRQYGLEGVLADTEAIALAWENLFRFLRSNHGEPQKVYHERPFRLEKNGQTIVGSMDLVWQTAEGDILIDFKTCPLGEDAVTDEHSSHYAGGYAGQLDAYEDALVAAGEQVLCAYIYYPVSGLLVEVERKSSQEMERGLS